MRNIEKLGATVNGVEVYIDHDHTNVTYHLLETPDLLDLVREALPTIELPYEEQVVIEKDMGRVVGTTNLVETTDQDEIIYAKRIGRNTYSRFAKNRSPVACNSIVVVFRKRNAKYYLWTAMCGKLLPKEAYDAESHFNQTHALAYDERLVQLDTLTNTIPLSRVANTD
ncbi:MAG TPA: hypothetical protein VFZ48_03395 [Candidatus Saccharimonadales bacterium]